ncbi:CNH domain-containing protein [Entamoeba marina]
MNVPPPSTKLSLYATHVLLQTTPETIRTLTFSNNKVYIGCDDGSIYLAEYSNKKFIIMKGVRVSRKPITSIQAFPRNNLLLFVTTLRLGALTTSLERLKVTGMDVIGEDCAVILRDRGVIKSRVDRFGMYSTQRTLSFVEYTKEKGFERSMKGLMFDTIPQTIEWSGDRVYYIQGDIIKFVRLSDRKVGVLRERRAGGKMRPFVKSVGEFVLISNSESIQLVDRTGVPVNGLKEVFPSLLTSLNNVVVSFPFVLCFHPDSVRIYNFFTGKMDDCVRIKNGIVSSDERDVVVCCKSTNGPIVLLKSLDLVQFINEYIKAEQFTVINQLLDSYSNELQTTLPLLSDQDILLVRVVYGGLLIEHQRYKDAFEQFEKCVTIKTKYNVTWDVRAVIAIFDDIISGDDKYKQYSPVDWKTVESKLDTTNRQRLKKEVYGELSEFIQKVQKMTTYDKYLETQRIKALIVSEKSNVVDEIEKDERRGWYIDVDNVLNFVKESGQVRVVSKLHVMQKDYVAALSIWNKLAMADDHRVYDYGIEDVLLIIQLLDSKSKVHLRLLRIALNWVIPEVFNEYRYLNITLPSIRIDRCLQFEQRSIKQQLIQILLKRMETFDHHTLLSYVTIPYALFELYKHGLKTTIISSCEKCISDCVNLCISIVKNNEYLDSFKKEVREYLQHVLQTSNVIQLSTILPSLHQSKMQNELIIIYERTNKIHDLIQTLMQIGGVEAVLSYCEKHPNHSTTAFDYMIENKSNDLPQVISSLIHNLDISHVLDMCQHHCIPPIQYLPIVLIRVRELANTYLALNYQANLVLAESRNKWKRSVIVDATTCCFLCKKRVVTNFYQYENNIFCCDCFEKIQLPRPFVFE